MDRVKAGLKRRGSILALVVISLVIILIIGAALLTLGWDARVFAIRTEADISARCAADSGLTKAIRGMNNILKSPGFTFDKLLILETDVPLSDSEPGATFSYKVNSLDLLKRRYGILSVGRCVTARRIVWGRLRLRGVGEPGVLVRESLVLKAGTIVDGRDSRLPPDDPGQFEITTQIGTISTADDMIVLNNGVYIHGDALVGFGGDPNTGIKDLGAEVTGIMGSLDEEPEFPPVTPPTLVYRGPKLYAKGEDLIITEAYSGKYDWIDLDNQGEAVGKTGEIGRPGRLIVASGNNIVLHLIGNNQGTSIDMGQGCEIIIEKNASLNLYVDGNIFSGTDSGFYNYNTPPTLKIWGQAHDPLSETPLQTWQLNAKSEFFGQVYAPEATVQVNAKGNLYGSFTAYNFEMKSGGNLFYDEALRIPNPNDPGVRFVLERWGEGAENLPFVAGL